MSVPSAFVARRGDLVNLDAFRVLVPAKVLSVTMVRERFGEPYQAAILMVTADRAGYARGEVILVRRDQVVARKTRTQRGSGAIMVTQLDLVDDSALRCDRCGGTARMSLGDYQVTHMNWPCDPVGPLSAREWAALDAFRGGLRRAGVEVNGKAYAQ